jgi:hypothetical protein
LVLINSKDHYSQKLPWNFHMNAIDAKHTLLVAWDGGRFIGTIL